MGVTRKAALVAALAIGAMALVTASASAQSSIEVWNEDEGVPCDQATGGHCLFLVEGESHVIGFPSNLILSTCEDQFFAEIQSDGTGVLEWIGAPHGGVGCNFVNCEASGEDQWEILSTTESGAGQINMIVRFCYRAPSVPTEVHCNINLSIGAPVETPHDYRFSTATLCVNATRRVEGSWQMSSLPLFTDEIEFVHN